jgi:hypothetical protein
MRDHLYCVPIFLCALAEINDSFATVRTKVAFGLAKAVSSCFLVRSVAA